MFLLKLFYHVLFTGYFYTGYKKTVWHPIYDQPYLSTEERRRIREEMLPNRWTQDIWWESLQFWGHRCAACRKKKSFLQKDHIVPLAHVNCPGAVPSNLMPLCEDCNKDKSYHDTAIWFEKRFHKPASTLIQKIHDWQYLCLKKGWR